VQNVPKIHMQLRTN